MHNFKDISKFEKRIGFDFENKDLIMQALVHRSYLNENRDFPLNHNERLEFLGDAVLELVVTDFLYKNFDNPEGELTNLRASLVNSNMLSKMAKNLDVEDLLYLSRGESKDSNTKARDQILANVFESVIGAIYMEFGYDGAKKFIDKELLIKVDYILENKLFLDPKTQFQEIAQEKVGITPHYKVLQESGPDHAKEFIVGLYLDKEKVCEGKGTSKQEAQINAAGQGLKKKGWIEK